MSCLTANPTPLSAIVAGRSSPDAAGINYYVKVDAATPSLTINFSDCESLSVSPTPATTPGSTSVTFTTADLDTVFTITLTYPASAKSIIETPTSYPKFKPVGSCP